MREWLEGLPPGAVYLVVALVIGLEFVCLPLPGGAVLIIAIVLSVGGHVDPWLVCASTVIGVALGSTAGYWIGKRGGRPLVNRLSKRFPRVIPPRKLAKTTAVFERWGAWGVLVSCFPAVLRMVSAPLCGTLSVPFWRFLVGISISAVLWSGGNTVVIHSVGGLDQSVLDVLILVGVAMAATFVVGVGISLLRRAATRKHQERDSGEGL